MIKTLLTLSLLAITWIAGYAIGTVCRILDDKTNNKSAVV